MIGDRIKEAREKRGFTQQELADACEVSRSAVTQWESGSSKNLRPDNLLAAAKHLNVNMLWLINGQGPTGPFVGAGLLATAMAANEIRDREADEYSSNSLTVPQLDLRASMGNGLMVMDHVDIVRTARINHSELRARRVHFSNPENLRLLTGYGDSMAPTFNDGDLLLVDIGVTELKLDAVYVLQRRDELFIKRIQRKALGGYRMISDNLAYPPEDIDPERDGFSIEARVCCVWNMRNL